MYGGHGINMSVVDIIIIHQQHVGMDGCREKKEPSILISENSTLRIMDGRK